VVGAHPVPNNTISRLICDTMPGTHTAPYTKTSTTTGTDAQHRSIPRRTHTRLLPPSPPALARERHLRRSILGSRRVIEEWTTVRRCEKGLSVEQGRCPGEEDVVESEVKECCKGLAECDQSGACPNDSSRKHVVPVMDCVLTSVTGQSEKQTDTHSSIVSAPEMSVAPSRGANMMIIFQYAGLCALITLSCALM
jgi:hypothetical protein